MSSLFPFQEFSFLPSLPSSFVAGFLGYLVQPCRAEAIASYRIQPCRPPRTSRHTLTPQMTRPLGLPPRAGLSWFRLVHWQFHCGWMFLGPVGLSLSWGQGPGLLNPQVRSQRKEQARDGLLGSSVAWVRSKVWEEGRRGSWKNLWLPWRHSTPQFRHWSTVLQLGTHFILEWPSPRGKVWVDLTEKRSSTLLLEIWNH